MKKWPPRFPLVLPLSARAPSWTPTPALLLLGRNLLPLAAGGRPVSAKPRPGTERTRTRGQGGRSAPRSILGVQSFGTTQAEVTGRRRGSECGVETQGGGKRWTASLEDGMRGQPQAVISVSLSFSWQCHLLGAAGQRGWGQPEPWTGGLRVWGFCFFVNPGGGLGSWSHPT